jgi:ribose transport system substrate-binding protein
MKRVGLVFLVLIISLSGIFAQDSSAKKWRIALCNDYAGNSWRQQMLSDWKEVTDLAISQGLIAEAPAFTTNAQSAADEAALLQNLVLEGYDAIVLDSASPTALNGAVKKAIDAGIPVISFDQTVTEPSAWKLITDFGYMGVAEVEFLAKAFPKAQTNILEIRGLSGTFADTAIHDAVTKTIKKYSNLKIVGQVFGNWTQTVAQKEVAGILPSLPKIDAVIAQGGDGYGSIKSFQDANRKIPLEIFGHRYDELVLWKELQKKAGGSYPTMSISIVPGSVAVGFWTALEILNKQQVPKEINMLPLSFAEAQLDYYLKHTAEGGLADIVYPQAWVRQLISNAKAGKAAPPDPLPN